MQTDQSKTEGSAAVDLHPLVRRFLLSLRWQFRRKVFIGQVPKAIWGDWKLCARAILVGALAPMVIVLSPFHRLIWWAAQPLVLPIIRRDPKLWVNVAAIIEATHNPPNESSSATAGKGDAERKGNNE